MNSVSMLRADAIPLLPGASFDVLKGVVTMRVHCDDNGLGAVWMVEVVGHVAEHTATCGTDDLGIRARARRVRSYRWNCS